MKLPTKEAFKERVRELESERDKYVRNMLELNPAFTKEEFQTEWLMSKIASLQLMMEFIFRDTENLKSLMDNPDQQRLFRMAFKPNWVGKYQLRDLLKETA